MALKIEEKEVLAATEERGVLNERINTNNIGGNKIIVTGVAILAGLILLYVGASRNNYFGLLGADKKVENAIAAKKAAGPKSQEIVIPPLAKPLIPETAINDKDVTTCAGGMRLPAGMPCPEASKGDMKMAGNPKANGNAGSNGTNQNVKPAIDEIRERRLGGSVSVATTMPVQSAEDYQKSNSGLVAKIKPESTGLSDTIPVTYTPKISAEINLNPNLTLSKGQMPDCNLGVAIRSSQPGFILCKLSMPVYSMNGKVVLMEAGTQIEGEYRATVKPGQSSIQAIFTRFVTPNGVVGQLDSPGTDTLGRAGLDGQIDKKWMERFGGAILSAVIEDGIDIYKAKSQSGGDGGTNIFNQTPNTNSSGKAITDELLKQGSSVQPELLKNQGEVIKIFVARDVDFSTVYELKQAK